MKTTWVKDESLHDYRINRHNLIDQESGKILAFVWRLRIPEGFPLRDVWKTQLLVGKGDFGRIVESENPSLIGHHRRIEMAKSLAEETLTEMFGFQHEPAPHRKPLLVSFR